MADKKDSKDTKGAKDGKDAAAAAPASKKKGLFIGIGSVLVVLSVAFVASLMAVPKKVHAPHLEGPFVAKLSKDQIQANLARAGGKRYVAMLLQAEYYAYSEAYVQGRLGGAAAGGGHGGASAEDPLYLATLKDALLTVAGTKTPEEITDTAMVDVFLEEVREAVDPVLFPVYVGEAMTPYQTDHKSGLRVGEDISKSTMRGLLHEHALKIDGGSKTIALDGGTPIPFTERDRNLKVISQTGEYVYLDCTGVEHEFSGSVPVGVPGRVRRIFKDSLLVQ